MSDIIFPLADFGGSIRVWETLIALTIILSFFPLRSRKRKQEEEGEESDDEDIDKEDDENEYASSDDEDLQSDAASSDDDDEFIDSEGDTRVRPGVRQRHEWGSFDLSSFQTVDGDKIFYTDHWYGRRVSLYWKVKGVLTKAMYALVRKQRKRTITLEGVIGRRSRLTQVPYRKLTMSDNLFHCSSFADC